MEAIDQKLDLLLSVFFNKDGTDAKMKENPQTKCSPDIKVSKDKDPEGEDGKQPPILGP